MKLSREMVKRLADAVASQVEAKKLVNLLKPRDVVARRLGELISEDLAAEERLNNEVKDILASHEQEIAKGGADYRKLFELTKQKLARERGFIL